jgi:hypothetical protein
LNPFDKMNQKRREIEQGPGGDHDRPFVYQGLGDRLDKDKLHSLISTMWLTLNGLLGGEKDGEDELG